MRRALGLAVACALAAPVLAGEPGHLAGRVTDANGEPIEGAFVTARAVALARETTVYTDPSGWFVLPQLEPGAYRLRARAFGYRDRTLPVELTDAEPAEETVVLEREPDPRELAWQLPANRWLALALARLPDAAAREEFVRQCAFCHQQGSWATRAPREPEDWRRVFTLMARMGGTVSSQLRHDLPGILNAAFEESSAVAALGQSYRPPPPPDALARRARVTEWDIGGTGSFTHDAAVHPDGSVYAVDMAEDKLYRLDPRTGERRTFDIPHGDLPLGGVFGQQQPIPTNAQARVGPHSLQVAPDGSVWITLALGNQLARFDPRTERFDVRELPDGLYPHTLRFDRKGRIWYTLALSNHVALFNPATGQQRAFRLPARTWGEALAVRTFPLVLWLGRHVTLDPERAGDGPTMPVPYGIDIAPDGGIWFSQLNERRIGRLDPESGAVRVIDTPFPAPRRLRFDSRGNLWIPSFSGGLLARFDPKSGEFHTWPLPIEPPGSEAPYALNVDRRTDTVWICGTQSDTLLRFEPGRERFTIYPLPTRVTYTRELDFDSEGAVWTISANLPAWQIEGGIPKFIRLEPGA